MTKEALEEFIQSGNIEFSPSQRSVSFPIINRIYRKMKKGIIIRNGISVSKDFVIVDGHHRYLASLFANFELATSVSTLSSAKEMWDWKNVEVVDVDWDSVSDIHKCNETDAYYNEMTMEQLLELIG